MYGEGAEEAHGWLSCLAMMIWCLLGLAWWAFYSKRCSPMPSYCRPRRVQTISPSFRSVSLIQTRIPTKIYKKLDFVLKNTAWISLEFYTFEFHLNLTKTCVFAILVTLWSLFRHGFRLNFTDFTWISKIHIFVRFCLENMRIRARMAYLGPLGPADGRMHCCPRAKRTKINK